MVGSSDEYSGSESSTYDPAGLMVPQHPRAYRKFLKDEERIKAEKLKKEAEESNAKKAKKISKSKDPVRDSLAKELFPSDEEMRISSKPHPNSGPTGKKASVRTQSIKPIDSNPTHDIANRGKEGERGRERRYEDPGPRGVRSAGESNSGTAKRHDKRDGRSRSPNTQPSASRQRGGNTSPSPRLKGSDSSHSSSKKLRAKEDKVASESGVYLKSKSKYNPGKQNWTVEVLNSDDDERTQMEKDFDYTKLEEAEKHLESIKPKGKLKK